MGRNRSQRPAWSTASFTNAQLADTNALVLSVATSAGAVTYAVATLDGVLANPGPSAQRMPQVATVTTSANGGTYTLTDITITGTLDGVAVTDTLTLTATGGNETIVGTQAFDAISSIARLAMTDANGLFEFGVQDVVLTNESPAIALRHGSAGNIAIIDDDANADTLAGILGERQEMFVLRVNATSTTSDPVTIFRGRGNN